MDRVFTAAEVEGKMDCYGAFNREDPICVAHCALNVHCAILKAKGGEVSQWEQASLDVFPACRTELH
ncbi:hypothetical protein SAMN02746041_01955 [Desulfacinum hydrothermale DSM 13146]|uniref:Uncharacterized protein n=1 Tax=Desulfacinum hydrothermale DSM 13146 TaxID=1121390 RepID=A0A1W1XK77_9BACT|nr:hypothetical protein [Desulfacinum hydrothermale]SMC24174.1 hypothetical protein SAMN02746041_01955 [Desulfacinum hydrothermale DSM 13146]